MLFTHERQQRPNLKGIFSQFVTSNLAQKTFVPNFFVKYENTN